MILAFVESGVLIRIKKTELSNLKTLERVTSGSLKMFFGKRLSKFLHALRDTPLLIYVYYIVCVYNIHNVTNDSI